jgi:transposase
VLLIDLVPFLAIRRVVLDGSMILLEASAGAAEARCPACGALSTRVHGRFVRRPLDLPWRGCTVRLVVTVRRFRCERATCGRVTFAEELGRLPRRARRTTDVTALLLWVVNTAGGEKGARLAAAMGVPTSADTLLRLQRAAGLPASPTPRVLGIDDLALRRGRAYATLFLDLETRRPIDLVKGRDAAVVQAWLAAHPGVEVVVRDRAGPYADGARAGAPSALQVADRFHLVRSASTALEELLRGRRRALEAALTPPEPDPATGGASAPPALSATARHDAERRAARVARWEKVHALRAEGWGIMRIAREMGMGPRTVHGLLASAVPPRNRQFGTRPPPLASPTLAPFAEYLRDRWAAGERNVNQLVREIAAQGYTGSTSLVRQAIYAWRPPQPRPRPLSPAARDKRRFKVRWLCLRPPDALEDDEQEALARLLAAHADLASGHALLQRFRRLVAEGDAAGLDGWLADARASGLASFEALANGLAADRAAVDAAFATPWSTGPVEGHVHRVKLIKRQGYGRAKLDLLRTRVLAAA